MAGGVAGLIHFHDGHLHQVDARTGGPQQHGEFVLVLVPRYVQRPFDHLRGEAAQPGLGVC